MEREVQALENCRVIDSLLLSIRVPTGALCKEGPLRLAPYNRLDYSLSAEVLN